MQSIKTSDSMVKQAAECIRDGNKLLADGKRLVEAGKASLSAWLKTERKVDVESLPIGEIVNVDKVCLIEIGKQTRFDSKTFQLDRPKDFADYQRDFPTVKYKPLV